MNKQPEITAATRQALIDAFWTLYAQKRVEKITIKEITQLAGYHRGTFYEYFLDIYDLLSQEEEDLIRQLEQQIERMQHTEEMHSLLRQIAAFYDSNARRINLLIGGGGTSEFMGRLKKVLYPTLQKMMEASGLEYASIVYEFGMNGMLMAFHEWYVNYPQLSADAFVGLLRSLVENGIPETIRAAQS